jgi:hypothetical protein
MLHVANGDTTAALLARAGLAGGIVSEGDILIEGPARNGLETREDWEFRAAFLQERLGIPEALYLARVDERKSWLARSASEDEVVLWFEEDLHCLVNLAYLLHPLGAGHPEARVSIVLPADVRLGNLAPSHLAGLFESRRHLTPAELAEGSAFWLARLRKL